MNRKVLIHLTLVMVAIVVLSLFQNCGTETGTPSKTVHFRVETTSTSALNKILPRAEASVATVQLCVHKLLVKKDGGSNDNEAQNAPFSPGLITLTSVPTELENLSLSKGQYSAVHFILKNDCGTGYSLRVTNSSGDGVHESSKPLVFRFEEDFEITDETSSLVLLAQEFWDNFNSVGSDSQAENEMELSVGGIETE